MERRGADCLVLDLWPVSVDVVPFVLLLTFVVVVLQSFILPRLMWL